MWHSQCNLGTRRQPGDRLALDTAACRGRQANQLLGTSQGGDLTVFKWGGGRFWMMGSYYMRAWHMRWFEAQTLGAGMTIAISRTDQPVSL